MALDVPSEILWKITYQILFIDASRLLPFVLLVSPDTLSQILRQQAVRHPLLSVPPFHSHLLQPSRCRLQVSLFQEKFHIFDRIITKHGLSL